MNRRGVGFYLNKVGVHGLVTDDRPNQGPGFDDQAQVDKQKFNPKKVSPLSYSWFKAEYFYSFADRLFFLDNEMNQALERAEMPGNYTAQEWALVRQALNPKDKTVRRKRFSNNFIETECHKLQAHRLIFREIMKQF
jgi:hypothetical protein